MSQMVKQTKLECFGLGKLFLRATTFSILTLVRMIKVVTLIISHLVLVLVSPLCLGFIILSVIKLNIQILSAWINFNQQD
jgi:hypothetical protein